MMKMEKDDPLRNHIEQIRTCADRAAELTQGLLAFSRKQVMLPRDVDLNNVVVDLEKMLQRLIIENIELTVKTLPHPLTVNADVGKIEQVLINLVTNVKEAMPNGGNLDISTSSETMTMQFLHPHGFGKPGD
jgi:two-component system cell cycle sensor histidine kinase/response regulator CckA